MDDRLASMDIRVLRFLRFLLQTGSVTRTAELMGISQPAASRVLARVRDLTGDPLLIRTQTGFQLTDHALALQQPVIDAIRAVQTVFQSPDFDPSASDQCFRIACTDYATACIVGPLMERLAEIAPRVQVHVSPLVPTSFTMLTDGDVDFVFYAGLDIKGDFIVRKLFDESYVLLMREGHPLLQRKKRRRTIEPQDIAPYRQIEFNFATLERLHTDSVMRIDDDSPAPFSAPFFTAMPFLIANHDAVAAVPTRLGVQLAKFSSIRAVPFRSGAVFPYYLLKHERTRHNPAVSWFVEEVTRIFA